MKIKIALAGMLVAGFVFPAVAQTTVETYYVVQDVKSKKCTIVDKKPASMTEYTYVSGDGVVYKTRTEAETAMKGVKICTTN